MLALIWALVLFPSVLRTRLDGSPIDGVRSFERSMGVLANARKRHQLPGRWVMVPKSAAVPPSRRTRIIRRRRQIFERLLAAAGATLILGLIPGLRWMLLIHLAIDVILAAYVIRLLQWKRDEQERAHVVRPLPLDEEDDGLDELLSRSS